MNRREVIAGAGALALASPLMARAQQPAMPVIGFLGPHPSSTAGYHFRIFEQALRELGYIDGQNVVVELRSTVSGDNQRADDDQLFVAAAELVRLRADVLVTSITEAALAAKKATTTIPIVMVSVGDPVATGLVDSLARPGRNITGMSRVPTPALMGKTLELLKEAVPGLVTVAVLSKPQNPLHVVLLKGLNPAARSLGLNLKIAEAETANDLQKAFLAMGGGGAGAVFVLIDGMFFINRTRIADLALKERLPSIFGSPEHVQAGGLISYGSSVADHYRRAATYVDKILKGAKPADLPVEQPTKFDLVINLKTAKALGLTIPPTLLARADEVIE